MNTFIKIILGFAASLLLASAASAQNYAIDWFAIAGGGATSTGSVYSVSGTIGQHDASAPLTAGTFSLTGGFWSLYDAQTTSLPLLAISLLDPNTVLVSWPFPSTGFALQQNLDLTTTNWTAPAETVADNGTNKFIMVSPPVGNRYFRLFRP
jgi:hypothetical protein